MAEPTVANFDVFLALNVCESIAYFFWLYSLGHNRMQNIKYLTTQLFNNILREKGKGKKEVITKKMRMPIIQAHHA